VSVYTCEKFREVAFSWALTKGGLSSLLRISSSWYVCVYVCLGGGGGGGNGGGGVGGGGGGGGKCMCVYTCERFREGEGDSGNARKSERESARERG